MRSRWLVSLIFTFLVSQTSHSFTFLELLVYNNYCLQYKSIVHSAVNKGCNTCYGWACLTKPKPWPNGDASWCKSKTWLNLRLRLARACVHLRWLAMTCAHFGRDQICTQVDASFSPFGHPTQVNASWVTSINLLLVNKIEDSLP